MRERALDPVVELVAQRFERSTFGPLGSVREEVLGIVKEIDVYLLDPQPPKRPPELVGEKLWVDAVPASVGVLGGGVDEIDPATKCLVQGRGMLGSSIVDSVAAEAE